MGGVPEAHGAHGAPSASGPEIYPHGGVLEAHRPRALKYTPTGGSPRPIGPGPSAKAHRPRPMEPMGPHMGPMGPHMGRGGPGMIKKRPSSKKTIILLHQETCINCSTCLTTYLHLYLITSKYVQRSVYYEKIKDSCKNCFS